MYLFDYVHRSEVLSHSHSNKVKQSPLIDVGIECARCLHVMCIVFNDVVGKMRRGLNSACFGQVNHLLLSKSFERTSGEMTLSWSETTWGETDLGRNDCNSVQR